MKTMILMAIAILAVAVIPAQAQYGDYVSQYTLCGSTFQFSTTAILSSDPETARRGWGTTSEGTIFRVGYMLGDDKLESDLPIKDVRLVAIDGAVICYSDEMFGCNGY